MGITVLKWAIATIKNGPELWNDYITVADPDSGATVRRDVRKLRDLSIGIIGCNDSQEFYRICRHHAPAGTVLEEYEPSRWAHTFEDFRALVRVELMKALLSEDNQKKAKLYLDILERRDAEHYAQKEANRSKKVEITTENNADPGLKPFKVVIEGI